MRYPMCEGCVDSVGGVSRGDSISESQVIKLLPSPDPLTGLPPSLRSVPRSATLLPRAASSLARCSSSSFSFFLCRLFDPIPIGTSFLIPLDSPSSSVLVLPFIFSIASSTEPRRPRPSSLLLIEFPAESLPFLSRLRVLVKIWAKPFLVGESDLSVMVKDICS